MMRAAAVRMCFPSPSGFGGIGERGKVIGVLAADDEDASVFVVIRRMSRTDAIRLRLWRINSECALNGLGIGIPGVGTKKG